MLYVFVDFQKKKNNLMETLKTLPPKEGEVTPEKNKKVTFYKICH